MSPFVLSDSRFIHFDGDRGQTAKAGHVRRETTSLLNPAASKDADSIAYSTWRSQQKRTQIMTLKYIALLEKVVVKVFFVFNSAIFASYLYFSTVNDLEGSKQT